MTHDGTRSGDRGGDSALIRGVRVTPAWQPEFLSGRIVAMVGSGLRESCAGRSMNASMPGPILARWELWRASFSGVPVGYSNPNVPMVKPTHDRQGEDAS